MRADPAAGRAIVGAGRRRWPSRGALEGRPWRGRRRRRVPGRAAPGGARSSARSGRGAGRHPAGRARARGCRVAGHSSVSGRSAAIRALTRLSWLKSSRTSTRPSAGGSSWTTKRSTRRGCGGRDLDAELHDRVPAVAVGRRGRPSRRHALGPAGRGIADLDRGVDPSVARRGARPRDRRRCRRGFGCRTVGRRGGLAVRLRSTADLARRCVRGSARAGLGHGAPGRSEGFCPRLWRGSRQRHAAVLAMGRRRRRSRRCRSAGARSVAAASAAHVGRAARRSLAGGLGGAGRQARETGRRAEVCWTAGPWPGRAAAPAAVRTADRGQRGSERPLRHRVGAVGAAVCSAPAGACGASSPGLRPAARAGRPGLPAERSRAAAPPRRPAVPGRRRAELRRSAERGRHRRCGRAAGSAARPRAAGRTRLPPRSRLRRPRLRRGRGQWVTGWRRRHGEATGASAMPSRTPARKPMTMRGKRVRAEPARQLLPRPGGSCAGPYGFPGCFRQPHRRARGRAPGTRQRPAAPCRLAFAHRRRRSGASHQGRGGRRAGRRPADDRRVTRRDRPSRGARDAPGPRC